MPLWFTLSCSKESDGNALQMANYFYETGLFVASEPDFLVDDLIHNPNYTDQWGLNNTGQYGGTVGLDINATQAWNITTGQDVTVAVLDHGIELDHPDLLNISPLSFDTESNTSPSLVLGNHGTACAGIIGAADNSIGSVGVAPNCTLMSISNSLSGTPNSRQVRANGISFAWQNGADIISNSWGSAVQYQIIDDAIDNALNQGRNGLGCVIVFSSGNNNSNVSYPANSNPDILAVGAMNQCGQRKSPTSCDTETAWGSNFGNELDIVAPGVLISTTDRQSNNGYNPNLPLHILAGGTLASSDYSDRDYTRWFNGTSSACPHVSGVAALVLSVAPTLTVKQVNNIVESTAQKVGSYSYSNNSNRPNGTWNNEMGYGLVDAYSAVLLAQQLAWSGPPQIDTYSYTTPSGPGSNPSYICRYLDLIGANNTTLAYQGITNVTWNEIYSSGQCYSGFTGSGLHGHACGTCETWTATIKITATNLYGSTTIYRTLAPPRDEPRRSSFKFTSTTKDIYEIEEINLPTKINESTNKELTSVTISVFNHYGINVLESNTNKIDISSLNEGIYFMKAIVNNKEILSLKLKK